ncbi:exostosin family protein [Nocardia huaxiensis]|uniref:Exostosin family protein n=1 Tax=Nocardia huaxiensis TaxID=2755382 RepID=A0A7D6ZPF6_9NOCA|nr:exostosin family protein [Nocardia huaxiensis]QLY30425.1 exostosin family protein [Nocardia huaxiensis]
MLDAVRMLPSFDPDPQRADIIFCDFETGFESWWPGTNDADKGRISRQELTNAIANAPAAVAEVSNRFKNQQVVVLEAAPVCNFSRLRTEMGLFNVRVVSAASHAHTFQQDWDVSIPMFGLPHQRCEPLVRDIEWSFMGSISHPIREVITELQGGHVESIESFSELHLADVPSVMQRRYVHLLSRSWFTVCPRGDELYSFRFAEALNFGSIPVVIADGWEPPFRRTFPPDEYMIRVPEADVVLIPQIVASLPMGVRKRMQEKGQSNFHIGMESPLAILTSIVAELTSSAKRAAVSRRTISDWRCSCNSSWSNDCQ